MRLEWLNLHLAGGCDQLHLKEKRKLFLKGSSINTVKKYSK